ncbi:right-handed parallel beta-helix repeat-containing protein [Caulobacter sp. RL271]|jgi:3-dehydroshikimate dehydratase|uniref:Right-handed parallel beta-helix repeat-containing protein n=1 Tax=Caulobacter segnis TaxID=88688 RepID=A0ABY4ZNM3_9CAUL|nr:right-handed parallel beta-helix repeat-containing protein [Caulobacter segnis]USQ94150.1 right-handed parallel beta-helix repeat-containing protein [Caulobacter segnis]
MIGTWAFLALALAQTPDPKPIAAVATGGPAATGAETMLLLVDREADDEAKGSLRWAIATSNAEPGRYRIEIAAPAIVLKSALPAIKGPVSIEGQAFARSGGHNVVDGSGYLPRDLKSCPGMVPGQYGTNVRTASNPGFALIDTKGVTLRGLEIRNFCIGVLILRTANAVIVDNRIVRNIGGAGVMLSGDDGKGGSTSNTTLDNKVLRNTFLENGDGLELTRGAAFNLIADNLFDGGTDNLEPSQGIEILWGNDNTVVRNRFVRYSDGLQSNWGARNYIGANTFEGNAFGISLTGAGNMVEGNTIRGNGIGIAVRPEAKVAANRISQNSIAGNGLPILRCSAGGSCDPKLARGGIVIGPPGLEHASFVGSRGMGVVFDKAGAATICLNQDDAANCHAQPQFGLAPPRLTSVRAAAGKLAVTGALQGPPASLVTVEIFAGRAGTSEGERYLGSIQAVTDGLGDAIFAGQVEGAAADSAITATSTTAAGASSAFSKTVAVAR